ncbi:hypothetical protein TNCV_1191811 [Trichonephila clavipes]|nr:hypothetical protein TNCV_1191811 [Trichonephila clavipes]
MMGKRLPLPGNVDELALQLEKIWQEILQKTIRGLYHFMQRRVATCIQKNPEGPKLANMVTNDAKLVTKVTKLAVNSVTKMDANLALLPRFHQVLIESPL